MLINVLEVEASLAVCLEVLKASFRKSLSCVGLTSIARPEFPCRPVEGVTALHVSAAVYTTIASLYHTGGIDCFECGPWD